MVYKTKSLNNLAKYVRKLIEGRNYLLLFAYNGVGKTRLSNEFKNIGKKLTKDEPVIGDTIYFNSFTEDLFIWDNDLKYDVNRYLRMNTDSKFFNGLQDFEIESRIKPFLELYTDINFKIKYDENIITFSKFIKKGNSSKEIENIKISRGEESIFIWCFFLAILQLVLDGVQAYKWVKYIYIDDPVSSLDDNNTIAVAYQLAKFLKEINKTQKIKIIVSSHQALFFSTLLKEMNDARNYYLTFHKEDNMFELYEKNDLFFYHHLTLLHELIKLTKKQKLYTYHFNILRNIFEKTATFYGYKQWSHCLECDDDDPNKQLYVKIINILNHGNYSIFQPKEMVEENKQHFKKIINLFLKKYDFNLEMLK